MEILESNGIRETDGDLKIQSSYRNFFKQYICSALVKAELTNYFLLTYLELLR
jgi:hypothetical protein